MKYIYLKSELKFDSFDVSIGIRILFFRVSVTIEPGRSLLTVRYHELFEKGLMLNAEECEYLIFDAENRCSGSFLRTTTSFGFKLWFFFS
jgi:hypothetical protein